MKSAFAGYIIIIIYSFIDLSFEFRFDYDMDVANLSMIEIMEKYDYPSEIHHTETEDGYILEFFRIPFGKHSNHKKPGYPIILEPGLFASSDEFFLLGSHSLPFYLADEGYDVWIVNFRGNHYSSRHKYLTEEDEEFWEFSWHEMGVYDVPAQIVYVCEQTDHEDVIFIGYSMGSTMYFVMASERPEFLKKVRAVIFLAPVAFLKHTKSPVRFLAPLGKAIKVLTKPITKGLFFEKTPAYDRFIRKLCTDSTAPGRLCRKFIFYISGKNLDQFTEVVMENLLTHFPDKTSTKTLVHYGQLILSGKFRQYDYGIIKNKKIYNSYKPPEYNLTATTTPLYIFIGKNDYFCKTEDLEPLFEKLPNIKTIDIVPHNRFTHLDFVIAKDAKTLLYGKILQRIKEILGEEEDYSYEYDEEEFEAEYITREVHEEETQHEKEADRYYKEDKEKEEEDEEEEDYEEY